MVDKKIGRRRYESNMNRIRRALSLTLVITAERVIFGQDAIYLNLVQINSIVFS